MKIAFRDLPEYETFFLNGKEYRKLRWCWNHPSNAACTKLTESGHSSEVLNISKDTIVTTTPTE